ncbi:MAG: Dabb family protein [Saprospiraceae bacterium]|nr:Dabb family protein [Saprospiraceae bacterium]
MNRRIFNQLSFTSLFAPILLWSPTNKNKEIKNTFVHHVYFWLKEGSGTAELNQLVAGLQALTRIKSLQSYHIGVPAATNRGVIDNSYTISWLLFFNTAEDEAFYQKDQIHLDFVKNHSHLWSKVIVYDSIDKK